MRRDAVAMGAHDAHRFLHRYAVKSRDDIRPEAWVVDNGIELVEASLDGASAQLIRLGDIVQIVLPERLTDPGARRFGMMHELDHFLKRHPSPTPTMMCKPRALRIGDHAQQGFETHANAFAGAVLLPDFLLRRQCEVSPVSLNIPWAIALDYRVSILTSSIRFTELASERCAAVFSRRGVVEWVATSPTFTRTIERGKRLDRDSVAWHFHAHGKIDDRDQLVPANAWLDTDVSADIVEHSTYSVEHKTVLSLLWVPEAVGACLGMP